MWINFVKKNKNKQKKKKIEFKGNLRISLKEWFFRVQLFQEKRFQEIQEIREYVVTMSFETRSFSRQMENKIDGGK